MPSLSRAVATPRNNAPGVGQPTLPAINPDSDPLALLREMQQVNQGLSAVDMQRRHQMSSVMSSMGALSQGLGMFLALPAAATTVPHAFPSGAPPAPPGEAWQLPIQQQQVAALPRAMYEGVSGTVRSRSRSPSPPAAPLALPTVPHAFPSGAPPAQPGEAWQLPIQQQQVAALPRAMYEGVSGTVRSRSRSPSPPAAPLALPSTVGRTSGGGTFSDQAGPTYSEHYTDERLLQRFAASTEHLEQLARDPSENEAEAE